VYQETSEMPTVKEPLNECKKKKGRQKINPKIKCAKNYLKLRSESGRILNKKADKISSQSILKMEE